MKSFNEPTVSPVAEQQRRLDILIKVLPEIVKQGDNALTQWVDKVGHIKTEFIKINTATEEAGKGTIEKLHYNSEVIDSVLKPLDPSKQESIRGILRGLKPKKPLVKRDPLTPDGSSQGIA